MISDVSKSVETTKEKEYKKYINFGKLYLKENSLSTNSSNYIEELRKDLINKFANSGKYIVDTKFDSKQNKLVAREEKLIFSKISSDENYFFGTFARVSNSKDVLTDIVDNESKEKIDPEKIYFEYNTLFYIDFKNSAISFIKTSHIKNVYPFLELFINNNNLLNIGIAPLIKDEEEIHNSVITQLDITCARTEINSNTDFIELKKLENMGCVVKDYKLTLSLENANSNFTRKLLNFRNKNKKGIKKMSISTLSEDIDLLTNTFTKSVPIKLTNNYEQNYAAIQYTLQTELIKAIQ